MPAFPLKAVDVAKYFLATRDATRDDPITPLKIQKLLYYAQGFFLAMQNGQPLFSEDIKAWKQGPVVRDVYEKYRRYRSNPIDSPDDLDPSEFPPEVREILDAVSDLYGRCSAARLSEMTHDEPPWMNTQLNGKIRHELLVSYFGELVEAGRQGKLVHGRAPWPTNSFRFQRRRELAARMDTHRDRLRAKALRHCRTVSRSRADPRCANRGNEWPGHRDSGSRRSSGRQSRTVGDRPRTVRW